MSEKEKNPLSKEDLLKFLEKLPQLRLNDSEENKFSREYGDIKWPSKDWKDVKHIRFRVPGKKEAVLDSFKEGKKEDKGSEEQHESKKHETGESKSKTSGTVKGTKIHKRLHNYLKERHQAKEAKQGQGDTDRELLQEEKKVIEEIETVFECTIIASEVEIQGFATNERKQHYWAGKIDAVAMDKNGRVLVIEWKTCGDVTKFWRRSAEYSIKLHQCLIYRELVDAHLKEYFGKKMDSGIMIVAIDENNTNVFKPRLCMDFKRLKEEKFFETIYEFTWQGSKQGRIDEHPIPQPCCCNSTCSQKTSKLRKGCPCKTKGERCSSHCGCEKFKCKNGKSEALKIEHELKTKKIETFVRDLSHKKMTEKLLTELLCNGRVSLDYARNLTNDYEEDVSDRKNPLEQKLEQKVKKSGLQFRQNVPGDGNCMFHAVADQLKRLGQQEYDHVELRNKAVTKLKEWKENLDCSEEYLEKMSKDGEWGTENELKALANALDIQIKVVVAYEDYPHHIFEAKKPQKGHQPILLGFDGNGHYYSLEPVVPGSLEEQLKQAKVPKD